MKIELAGPIWGRRDQNPPGANTGWTDTGWIETPSRGPRQLPCMPCRTRLRAATRALLGACLAKPYTPKKNVGAPDATLPSSRYSHLKKTNWQKCTVHRNSVFDARLPARVHLPPTSLPLVLVLLLAASPHRVYLVIDVVLQLQVLQHERGDFDKLVGRAVGEVDVVPDARHHPRDVGEEFDHPVLVPGHGHDEVVLVDLHDVEQDLDRLLPVVASAIVALYSVSSRSRTTY